jgi:uncharacterized membrane protein YphA (DoxX/SURF4 family)
MTAPEHPAGTGTASPQGSVSAEPQKSGTLEFVGFLGRWVLGAVFIYMGLSKALHPEDFLSLVRQYELTNNPVILNSLAAALPWFEAICGVLLVAGVAVRGTALVSVLLLVPFTLVILKRASALSAIKGVPFTTIKFDCGCGAGEVVIWHKLIENGLLVLLGIWLVAGYGRSQSIRYCLFRERKRPAEPKA